MKKTCYSRKNRLITKIDFKSVFDQAKKVGQKYILILYKKNRRPQARLGLIIAKRAVPHASSRNQIKRILRESFRHNQESLTGTDIIIIVKQACDKLSKAQLRENIEPLWKKLKTSCLIS